MGQHKVHGTSLVELVFTEKSGAFTYALNGSVDILASLLLAYRCQSRARFANALPEWKLKRSFVGFLVLISLLLLLKPYL